MADPNPTDPKPTGLPNRRAPVLPGAKPVVKPTEQPAKTRRLTPPPSQPAAQLPAKQGRWKIRVGVFFAILLLFIGGLAGAGYYLTTDSGARKFILPLISKKLGAEITAEHIHWKPFSSLKIDGLRLGPEKEPLLKVKQLIAQYDGWRMLRGNYEIQHLSLDSPVVRLGQKPDASPEGAPRIMQSGLASSQIFTVSLLDAENVQLSYAGHGLSAILHPFRLHAKIHPGRCLPG